MRGLIPYSASSKRAVTPAVPPLRRPQTKEDEGASKSSTQGSETYAKKRSTTSAKEPKQSPSPTNTTVSTNGRQPAVKPSVTAAVAAKRRVQKVFELSQPDGGHREESTADRATATVAVIATSEPSTKVTAFSSSSNANRGRPTGS